MQSKQSSTVFCCPQLHPVSTSDPDSRGGCSSSYQGRSGAEAQGPALTLKCFTWLICCMQKLHISCQLVRISSFHIKIQISELLSKNQEAGHWALSPASCSASRARPVTMALARKPSFSSSPESFLLQSVSQTLRPSTNTMFKLR